MGDIKKIKIQKYVLGYVTGLAVIVCFVFIIGKLAMYMKEYNESEYRLEEVEDGIYLITYRVSSNVPAHNYDVATICVNGNLLEYKGDLRIVYTEYDPYCVIGSYVNLNYSDEITVYIPKGSVKFQENVGIR